MESENESLVRLIPAYASAMVESMLTVARSIKDLEHPTVKGTLRECLVSNVLKHFLSSQFGVTSGVVVDSKGAQSNQTDVIIFDNRVMAPFIRELGLGVAPAESVVAVIEVRSRLSAEAVRGAASAAERLKGLHDDLSLKSPPLAFVVGFYEKEGGSGLGDLRDAEKGSAWLEKNAQALDGLLLAGEYSWLRMQGGNQPRWVPGFDDPSDARHEGTKRFFAVLLDNCRTRAEKRWHGVAEHKDWFSAYIRYHDAEGEEGASQTCAGSDMSVGGVSSPADSSEPGLGTGGATSTGSSLIDDGRGTAGGSSKSTGM